MDQSDLGKRIRLARERIGMSQEVLAERVERDQKAISEYETGKRKLPAVELPLYAVALGVPVIYFFDGDFQIDELDQVLLKEFHGLSTHEDKRAAIEAIRLISEVVRRYTGS